MDRRGFLRLPAALAGAALAANIVKAQDAPRPRYWTLHHPLPQPKNPVSLIEFFQFRSNACYDLEPAIKDFVTKSANSVRFTRIYCPAEENDLLERLYYTLDEMGQAERFIDLIFYSRHVTHYPFISDSDIVDFAAFHGLDRAKFIQSYNSYGVRLRMKRNEQTLAQLDFAETPTFIVDGRIATSATYAGVRPVDLISVVKEMIAGA